ncbi:MAG: hypothetical protein KDJ16_03310 [Hyphomicrobiales bacterium]|nr:hypothetical protein [Hyphomicrobiales bacterium]
MYSHPIRRYDDPYRPNRPLLEDAALAIRLADLDRRPVERTFAPRSNGIRGLSRPSLRRRLAAILFETARRLDPATVLARGMAAGKMPQTTAIKMA